MPRPAGLLPLLLCILPPRTFAQDIAALAKSPHELPTYIQTHSDFDWQPLWRTLNISGKLVFLPKCEEGFANVPSCSAEVISAADPRLLILLIRYEPSQFEAYLRYQPTPSGQWLFSGAYAPFVKYFPPQHRMTRFDAKPFLVVTAQGNAGTGLSSKIEEWIDLTASAFNPALSFTSEGDKSALPGSIGRNVHGLVTALETKPMERITVNVNIDFETIDKDEKALPLGGRRDNIVYVRRGTKFEIDPHLSTASPAEVEDFYNDLDSDLTREEFLRFNFEGLLDLANGEDTKGRLWLSDFLRNCPDIPESRRLKSALASKGR